MQATAPRKPRGVPEHLKSHIVFEASRLRLAKTMELPMRKIATIILLSASLFAAACNTVKGAGEDIESVGKKGEEVIN
jgi:predicted small secreted protein